MLASGLRPTGSTDALPPEFETLETLHGMAIDLFLQDGKVPHDEEVLEMITQWLHQKRIRSKHPKATLLQGHRLPSQPL